MPRQTSLEGAFEICEDAVQGWWTVSESFCSKRESNPATWWAAWALLLSATRAQRLICVSFSPCLHENVEGGKEGGGLSALNRRDRGLLSAALSPLFSTFSDPRSPPLSTPFPPPPSKSRFTSIAATPASLPPTFHLRPILRFRKNADPFLTVEDSPPLSNLRLSF